MSSEKRIRISRYILVALFCFAGVQHFLNPSLFMRAMPAYLPWPLALIYISGFFEVLGAIGLLSSMRYVAGIGLIALLVAVFPANIHMAMHPELFPEVPPLLLYVRLPLQLALIAWAHHVSRK